MFQITLLGLSTLLLGYLLTTIIWPERF
ncbi:MAG: potassium-transporting ATPase subunit F [Simkaniaceae bacterium]|nr:potassium-transporting ATPase subunit F [Simkaniaceae bacterium]